MKKNLKKITFASETNYFDYLFGQCQKNSRKTWSLINRITCRKKRDDNTIFAMKTASGQITNDAKTIANTLNEYFTKIGPNMSNCLPVSTVCHKQFMKNRQRCSLYLTPTDPIQVLEKLDTFSKKESTRARQRFC